MELVCVDPATASSFWPFVKDKIYRAIHKADISPFRYVESAVLSGNALLWLAIHDDSVLAAAVTQLEETERRKVCTIVACGGTQMSEWLPLIRGIEKYAGTQGCHAVRIVGRLGWIRALRAYHVHSAIIEKDIS